MKLRKLTSALVAAGALSSPWALGLGLGDITLKSSLNQPLQAEIKLLQTRELAEEEVLPSLAAQQEFDRAGVERFFFLNNIDFDVELSGKGDGVLLLTTKQSIQEPFLNFLVEVNWPNGRVLREYTVLLDPPVYEDEAPEIVVTPQTSAPVETITQAEKAVVKKTNSQASVTPVASNNSSVSGTYGPVGASDTLWDIALEVRPDRSVSVQQTMMAIQELNPNAFVAGNINKIKRGSVLRVPSLEQVQQWSEGAAVKEVAKHNKRYKESIGSESSSQIQLSGVDQTLQSNVMEPEAARLKIVRSEDAAASSGSASGDQTGTDSSVESLQNELAISQENLDKANRENEKLTAQVKALEERMAKLSRLVTLKDSQMAELQMGVSDQEALDTALAEAQDMSSEMNASMVSDQSEMMTDSGASDADSAMQEMDAPVMDGSADGSVDEPMSEGMSSESSVTDQTEEMLGEAEKPIQAEIPPPSDKPVIKLDDMTVPVQQPEQGFVAKLLGNPIWLVAVGAGSLLFVILLFMMSRRSYQRENDLVDTIEKNPASTKTSMDIADEELSTIDEELDNLDLESQGFGQVSLDGETNLDVDDVIARADSYIAYGQFDNATGLLEEAINNEPNRVDLRLKMLEVFAETQDTQGFERQKQEILSSGADDVTAQIQVLEQKLPGFMGDAINAFDADDTLVSADSVDSEADDFDYSLEDLESELASDLSGDSSEGSLGSQDSDLDDLEFNLDEELGLTDSKSGDEIDLSDSAKEFSLDAELGEGSAEVSSGDELAALDDLELEGFDADLDAALDSDDQLTQLDSLAEESRSDGGLELDSGLELEDSTEEYSLDDMPIVEDNVLESSSDLESAGLDSDEFSMDDSLESDLSGAAGTLDADADLDMDDLEDLAKSLGVDSAEEVDLDAELASASEGTSSLSEPEATEDELLSEESVVGESLDIDSDLSLGGLDDAELDLEGAADLSVGEDELVLDASLDSGNIDVDSSLDELSLDAVSEPELSHSEDLAGDTLESSVDQDADVKSSLNEEELDFYVGADEVATKLDLARAYVDMGDVDGAKDILEEVIVEGNEDQKTEATELLNGLS